MQSHGTVILYRSASVSKYKKKKMKRINSWTQHQYGCIQFTYMYYYIKRESNKIIIYRKLNSRKCNEFYSIYAKIDDIDFCEQLNMVVYCCIVCIMMVISSKAFLSSSIFFFSNTSIHPSIYPYTNNCFVLSSRMTCKILNMTGKKLWWSNKMQSQIKLLEEREKKKFSNHRWYMT